MNRPIYEGLSGRYQIVETVEPITITVTDEDVENAIPHDPRNCAIAEACRRNGAVEAVIGSSVAYIVAYSPLHKEKVAFKYTVSRSARRAIDLFDLTGKMQAKTFTLNRLKPSETSVERVLKRKNAIPSYNRDTQPKRPAAKLQLRNVAGIANTRAH